MYINKSILIVLSVVFLSACGDGGGSDDSSNAGNNPGSSNSIDSEVYVDEYGQSILDSLESGDSPSIVPEAFYVQYEKTADVIVPNQFLLDGGVDIELSVYTATEGYLSVCSEYSSRGDGSYDIEFDSCSLRQRVVGSEKIDFTVGADVDSLIAAVYFFDGSATIHSFWYSKEGVNVFDVR